MRALLAPQAACEASSAPELRGIELALLQTDFLDADNVWWIPLG